MNPPVTSATAGPLAALTGSVRENDDLDIPLLVDEERRPKGWLSENGLQAEWLREELHPPANPRRSS